MGNDVEGRICPDCGADMSQDEDGEWECDGYDCDANLYAIHDSDDLD